MLRNLIDKMKLPFRKERELLSKLYDVLGFYPSDVKYYRQALTHKSQRGRDKDGQRQQHNERLEFLGDAIIGAIVSDVMYHRFPKKGEGFLTNTRSKVVQRESLNRLADQLGVTRLVRVGKGTSEHAQNIGGNALEALVGAIYLDRGYDYCRRFIHLRIVKSLGDLNDLAMREINYKSKLIEWAQKNRFIVQFPNLPDSARTDENSSFVTGVTVEGIEIAQGEGANKKESHQRAAFAAWERIQTEGKLKDKIIAAHANRRKQEDATNTATVPGLQRSTDDTALRAEQRYRNKTKNQLQTQQGEGKKARQERSESADTRQRAEQRIERTAQNESRTANEPRSHERQPKPERQPREERKAKAPAVAEQEPAASPVPKRVVAEVVPEVLPTRLEAEAPVVMSAEMAEESVAATLEAIAVAEIETPAVATAVEQDSPAVSTEEVVPTATKPAIASVLASLQEAAPVAESVDQAEPEVVTAEECVVPNVAESAIEQCVAAEKSAVTETPDEVDLPAATPQPRPAVKPKAAPAIASMLSALQEAAPIESPEQPAEQPAATASGVDFVIAEDLVQSEEEAAYEQDETDAEYAEDSDAFVAEDDAVTEAVDQELALEADATRHPRQSRQGQRRRGGRRQSGASAGNSRGAAPQTENAEGKAQTRQRKYQHRGRVARAQRRPRQQGGGEA